MKKRKILAVTSTRADYGIQSNIYKKIEASDNLELLLIATGMHLSREFGHTIDEITADGINVFEEIPIIGETFEKARIPHEMARLTNRLSEIAAQEKPDLMLLLGDRYEILAAATSALVMNIPIAHISGGEVTEGAIDNQIRNAISQMAELHFPGADEYAENLIKMGIDSKKIFTVGDPAIENIKNTDFLSVDKLQQEIGIKVDEKTLLVTFHPVTHELENLEQQINNLIAALRKHTGYKIITYPNSDEGSEIIIDKLTAFARQDYSVKLIKSLGKLRYYSAMKHCGAIVGNSSSAIIEAPFLKKPVVNVGNRQKGRLMSECIINCDNDQSHIEAAIQKALSNQFKSIVKNSRSLYGEGNTSTEIVNIIEKVYR